MNYDEKYVAEAVISISPYNESPEQAIQSVIRNHKYFAGLHIVRYTHSANDTELYPEWTRDLVKLREYNLEPVWHTTLDANQLKKQAVIHISPDHQIAESALVLLYSRMVKDDGSRDHYAVTSIMDLTAESSWKNPLHWMNSMTYGFLILILWADTLRSIVHGFRYHCTYDLRAQTVISHYPKRASLSGHRWWAWLFFTRTAPSITGDGAVAQKPSSEPLGSDMGFNFVFRTIRLHNHLSGWGFWWLSNYIMFYLVVTFPIYSNYISVKFDTVSLITNALYICNTCVMILLSYAYMKIPFYMTIPLCVMHPAYMLVSPFVWIVGRWY